jgi:hypothetical protein
MTKAQNKGIDHILQSWSFGIPADDTVTAIPRTIWRQLYDYWMKFAHGLGRINALILLTLVYFVVIGPAAVVLRLFGKDLLDRKAEKRSSFWYKKDQEQLTLERSKQQF